jgi:hypothetical protein
MQNGELKNFIILHSKFIISLLAYDGLKEAE